MLIDSPAMNVKSQFAGFVQPQPVKFVFRLVFKQSAETGRKVRTMKFPVPAAIGFAVILNCAAEESANHNFVSAFFYDFPCQSFFKRLACFDAAARQKKIYFRL